MNAIAKRRLQMHTLVLLTLLLLTAASALFFPARVKADSASQINSLRIYWVTEDTVQDGIASRLYQRASDDNSKLRMQYQIDFSLSGESTCEPGAIRVLVPRQIWHKRSPYFANGVTLNEGYGNISFSVPNVPSSGADWHWEEADDLHYVIINDSEISSSAGVRLQISFTDIEPSEIVDMKPSESFSVRVDVAFPDGKTDSAVSNELNAVVDTRSFVEKAKAEGSVISSEEVPQSILDRLPGGPSTAIGYVFVRWSTWPEYEVSQRFSLDADVWAGEAQGNGPSIQGIMLGSEYTNNSTIETDEFGDSYWHRNIASYRHDREGSRIRGHNQYVWVAYPSAGMINGAEYTIRTKAVWTMTESDPETGTDPQEISQAECEGVLSYIHTNWVYPPGQFGVYKYSGLTSVHTHDTVSSDVPDGSGRTGRHKKTHTYEIALGALAAGQPVTTEYEVLTTGYGYVYTAGPAEEIDMDDSWRQDTSHYLNWSYVLETTDDTVSILSAGNDSITLDAGSYRFDGITVGAPEMFTYGYQAESKYRLPGTAYGYKPDRKLEKPEIEIYVKNDGSWEFLQSLHLSGSSRYIPFPEGVTGYRTRFATNQAAAKLAVWPRITLLPDPAMQEIVEDLFLKTDTPETTLTNNVRMTASVYYAPSRPDDVTTSQADWLAQHPVNQVVPDGDSSLAKLTGAGYGVEGNTRIFDSDVTNDTANRQVVIHVRTDVHEISNLTDKALYDQAVAIGAVRPETSGTWYILLPKDVMPVPETIRMTRQDDHITGIEFRENYRGSGRILLVIHAALTPAPKNSGPGSVYEDVPALSFDSTISWTDLKRNTDRSVTFYTAFESGNKGTLGTMSGRQGRPDAPEGIDLGASAPNTVKSLMTDLDPDSNDRRFVYSYDWEPLTVDIAEQTEFSKSVRSDTEGLWSKGTKDLHQVTVLEGGNYTYRLQVTSMKNTQVSGILFYDSLESFTPTDEQEPGLAERRNWHGAWNGTGHWRGTLESVDVSDLRGKGCRPEIYYSTVAGLSFGNSVSTDSQSQDLSSWGNNYNLENQTIWNRVPDEDLINHVWTVPEGLTVTAVAVDARKDLWNSLDFKLQSEQSASVLLHMKAPEDPDGASIDNAKAKGAFCHTADNTDVDWDKAFDPKNNMYAYNAATLVYVPMNSSGSESGSRQALQNEYTRVGIVPAAVRVTKTWDDNNNHDGKRPDSVTVTLLRKLMSDSGLPVPVTDENGKPITLTLTEADRWAGIFSHIPAVDENGNGYYYSVSEDPVDGYTAEIRSSDNRIFSIVNTHKDEKITITGEKLWLDVNGLPVETAENQIRLYLHREGYNESTSKIIRPDSSGKWLYSFTDLDRYASGGTEYKYYLTEDEKKGWVAQNAAVPTGMDINFEYDPEDLTTFRNIEKPHFGNIFLVKHLQQEISSADADKPQFSFIFELTDSLDAVVEGEFPYAVYDYAPAGKNPDTSIPESITAVRTGTVSHNSIITVGAGQSVLITGLPEGSWFTLTEESAPGWTSHNLLHYGDPVPSFGQIGQMTTTPAVFENEYLASGSFRITAEKYLTGRLPKAGEFTFELVDRTPDSVTEGRVISRAVNSPCLDTATAEDGTVTGIASVSCSPVSCSLNTFGSSKTLTYEVREVLPDNSDSFHGIDYDSEPHIITVTIIDNGDGTVRTEIGGTDDSLVFRNEYHAETEFTVSARKEMTGRAPLDGEFSFEIRRDGAEADSEPLASGTNNRDGLISFSPAIMLTEKDIGLEETGTVRLILSEVQGSNPEIAYSEPVPYEVTLIRKSDGTLAVQLPGQTVDHDVLTCPDCGGAGKIVGLFASVVKIEFDYTTYTANASYDGDPVSLQEIFNSSYMDICPDCGGTGFDVDNPSSPCPTCRGYGFDFKHCTHPNMTEDDFCPDCLNEDYLPVPLPDGSLLIPTEQIYPLDDVRQELEGAGLDLSRFDGGSYMISCAYFVTADQWAAAVEAQSMRLVQSEGKPAYLSYISNDPCPTCGGTGTVEGDIVITGDPVIPVLTNHLKGRIDIEAEKTMEGKPAADPFTFVLLEENADETETEIASVQNSEDGKIVFDTVWQEPDGKDHIYVIREIDGENRAIAYDSSEIRYMVSVTEDDRGMPVVTMIRTEGDGVFRNTYKDGTLALTVSMKNADPKAEPPVFPVTVVLTGRDGKPLANRTFSAPPTRGRLRSAGTPVLETDENGRGTVMVAGGSTLVIPAIPHGTAFELSQAADTMPENFSQSGAEGTEGTITGGAESKASFENTFSAPKPSASVSPSPTPTPTPTPKSSPSASPSPTPTPTPAATAKAVSAPTPTFTPTPSPAPSATPVTTPATTDLPGPTSTLNPYVYRFSFTKKWEGSAEDSIDFVVYNPDGTVRSKKFNKKIISDTEWLYEAWFTSPADLYVIEAVPRGYRVRYENTGINAGVADRCCNGGTIVNYTVPKTGDRTNLLIFLGLSLLGIGCFIASFILGPCAESRSVRKWKKTARQANGNRMDPDGI